MPDADTLAGLALITLGVLVLMAGCLYAACRPLDPQGAPVPEFQSTAADGCVHLVLSPAKARALADAWEYHGMRDATGEQPAADLEAAQLRRTATTAALESGQTPPQQIDVPLFGERHLALVVGGDA